VVEGIIEKSGTPYFSFKDIDENKPSGSIRIRVETIHYFLKRYVEDIQKRPLSSADIDRQLAEFENRLRNEMLREAELAALARQQQEAADKLNLSRRLLPVINSGGPPASHLGA
jgi:DNA repair ATPase RecN